MADMQNRSFWLTYRAQQEEKMSCRSISVYSRARRQKTQASSMRMHGMSCNIRLTAVEQFDGETYFQIDKI